MLNIWQIVNNKEPKEKSKKLHILMIVLGFEQRSQEEIIVAKKKNSSKKIIIAFSQRNGKQNHFEPPWNSVLFQSEKQSSTTNAGERERILVHSRMANCCGLSTISVGTIPQTKNKSITWPRSGNSLEYALRTRLMYHRHFLSQFQSCSIHRS